MKHTIFKYAVIGITTGVIVSLLKKENRKAIQTKGKSVKEKLQEGNIKETLEKVTETSKQFSAIVVMLQNKHYHNCLQPHQLSFLPLKT